MNRIRNFYAIAVTVSLLAAAAASAGGAHIDKRRSRIGFVAFTKLFEVEGTFSDWSADLELDRNDLSRSRLNVDIDVASLDTGIDARDRHVRAEDFLHTDAFAHATFVSVAVRERAPGHLTVLGDLTIRGVTRRVNVPVRVQTDADGTLFAQARISVDRFDYGIAYRAGVLTPSVDDRVDIVIALRVLPTRAEDGQS